ncbi:MAG: DeoR/GlpR family DNA-binding transcription regulator [Lentisphaeria bacterium]|nr:DeoR/GlpR family DNA-binding transcription regulator [Lentisphaeria bacterium]MDY0175525.1 DeoR/GlpR family DNA-binding transcription regulator [Lentisphaeria bacterium]NLZ60034.1 DeoR/GlpR transcriptional regulator [Lentisphaerota bacterium]
MSLPTHKLLTAEREQFILELLRQSDALSVAALSARLEVSEATVRRDLQSLHERGLLERVHGGATLRGLTQAEMLFSDKEGKLGAEKQRIAAAALELIQPNDSIFLDGGSTVLQLARLLEAKPGRLTIVTNSLMAAYLLMESRHRLILCGGELRALSRTLVGPLSAPVLQSISVDKAFMGSIGLTLKDGMSTTDANEAFTKKQIMSRSRQVILLADHSKFGLPSFVNSGALQDLDLVVCDAMPEEFRERFVELGVRIIVA